MDGQQGKASCGRPLTHPVRRAPIAFRPFLLNHARLHNTKLPSRYQSICPTGGAHEKSSRTVRRGSHSNVHLEETAIHRSASHSGCPVHGLCPDVAFLQDFVRVQPALRRNHACVSPWQERTQIAKVSSTDIQRVFRSRSTPETRPPPGTRSATAARNLSVDQATCLLPEPVGVLAVPCHATHETLRAYTARVLLTTSAEPGCGTRFTKDRSQTDEAVPGHRRTGGPSSNQAFDALCLGRAGHNPAPEARAVTAVRSR